MPQVTTQAWLALPCRTALFVVFPDPCRPSLVNGPEYFEVVDSNSDFGFVRLEKLLNNEQFFVERILRRVVWQEIDLAYEVIPGDIAHDVNGRGTTLCSIG